MMPNRTSGSCLTAIVDPQDMNGEVLAAPTPPLQLLATVERRRIAPQQFTVVLVYEEDVIVVGEENNNKVAIAIPYDADCESEPNDGWMSSTRRHRYATIGLTILVAVASATTIAAIVLNVITTINSNRRNKSIELSSSITIGSNSTIPEGLLGDWEGCDSSLKCSNGCCSSTFSQGLYKCTPLDGGYLPGTCIGGDGERHEVTRGDWAECNSSLQCSNGCCSKAYSEGFFKCTPLIGGYLGDPDICISHVVESQEWDNCITSDECSEEGCCSSTYSNGVLKCTPLVGGFRSDTCV